MMKRKGEWMAGGRRKFNRAAPSERWQVVELPNKDVTIRQVKDITSAEKPLGLTFSTEAGAKFALSKEESRRGISR